MQDANTHADLVIIFAVGRGFGASFAGGLIYGMLGLGTGTVYLEPEQPGPREISQSSFACMCM